MINELREINGLGYFLYRSSALPNLGGGDLQKILRSARNNNQMLGLTGCLHYEDGLFFQWLEGPKAPLIEVVETILDDGRHSDINILDQGALDHRRFQDWRMRFSDKDRASLMDWFASSENSTFVRRDYAGGVTSFLLSIAI